MSKPKIMTGGREQGYMESRDFYETPPIATQTLLDFNKHTPIIDHRVWEPCCGKGAITNVLRDSNQGFQTFESDIYDYGSNLVKDAYSFNDLPLSCKSIVTNPPYNIANGLIRHFLKMPSMVSVSCLLRMQFIEGHRNDDRNYILDEKKPSFILPFKKRLPMMHREGYEGKKSSSAIVFAWFVWLNESHSQYTGETRIVRV